MGKMEKMQKTLILEIKVNGTEREIEEVKARIVTISAFEEIVSFYIKESKWKMAKQQKIAEEEEEKTYKHPVLFLRKSKAGQHLYAFNRDGILGGGVESLIMNVSDVTKVLEGKMEWIKVSVMEVKEEG